MQWIWEPGSVMGSHGSHVTFAKLPILLFLYMWFWLHKAHVIITHELSWVKQYGCFEHPQNSSQLRPIAWVLPCIQISGVYMEYHKYVQYIKWQSSPTLRIGGGGGRRVVAWTNTKHCTFVLLWELTRSPLNASIWSSIRHDICCNRKITIRLLAGQWQNS